jgi:hypothetical protein
LHFPENYRISKRENAESRRITKPFAARWPNYGDAGAARYSQRNRATVEARHFALAFSRFICQLWLSTDRPAIIAKLRKPAMSLLKSIDLNALGTPVESKAAPDRLISGDPSYKTWELDSARGDSVHSGVWEATPGLTHSIKGETFEFCHILQGVVELTEKGGTPITYKAGDSFLMKPGFVGTWRTIETVRKIYVTVS